ncbi:MAG: hypothetical protein LBU04_07920 [Christensenellaceae bacterium]|jgi:uncharacterized spore protein YtfJ|nr:hypothetical protein [Christensenellaceae bacterium]
MVLDDLSNMINEVLDRLKKILENDVLFGAQFTLGKTSVIPINKISAGFVNGGLDIRRMGTPKDEQPLVAIGGGLTVEPMGFLILSDCKHTFISMNESESKTNKFDGIIESIISKLK